MKRKSIKHKGRTIARLPSGRYQIRIKDSDGKPYRPSYPTLTEAKDAVEQFQAKQVRGERFLVAAAHTTFSELLDLRRKQMIKEGLSRSALEGFDSRRRVHLEPAFGHRPITEFIDDRMQFVKDWFEEKKDEGRAQESMDKYRMDMKLAFAAGVSEGKLAPPNPILAFDVSAPHVDRERRATLPIDDITALVRGALMRDGKQHMLATELRYAMVIVGLSVPLRTQDLCGLCWDCIDLEGRVFYLHRVVMQVHGNKRWALVDTTKTGEEGKGECHMSPPAHAVLSWWRDRLRERGLPTDGRVPALRPAGASMLTPSRVQATYVRSIIANADLLLEDGTNRYTWYNLRHTVPSMWSAIGMGIEQIKDRLRHLRLQTTEIYRRPVPEYRKKLRPAVDEVIDALDIERTPEGLIDALGIVLARMWQAEGIDVPCSPPTTMRQKRLPNYHRNDESRALEGPVSDGIVIDMEPTAVSTTAFPSPMEQLLLSRDQMAELRRAEAKRLSAPPHNWTPKRIADHLGVADVTVGRYLDGPDAPRRARQMTRAERAKLRKQVAAMHQGGANSREIGDALNITPELVSKYERKRGVPMQNPRLSLSAPRRSWKLGPHEERIKAMIAEDKTNAAIARELGVPRAGVNKYIQRLGLRTKSPPHPSWKLGPHEERIKAMIAQGKNNAQIARELGFPNRAGVNNFIKRRGLRE